MTTCLEVKNAEGEVLASLQPPAPVPDYRTRSGAAFTSVHTLSPVEREAFLNKNDPVRRLALNDESVFYRGMPRERVLNGRVAGNPDTIATIQNHQAVRPNPLAPTEDLTPAQVEQLVSVGAHLSAPVKMNANELPEPSLNVAFGTEAEAVARAYAKEGVVVKMRLGDLRAAKGGMVFDDDSAVLNRPGRVAPLVVTLPQGGTVPVQIV